MKMVDDMFRRKIHHAETESQRYCEALATLQHDDGLRYRDLG
jgi:hypothetical protein